MTKKDVQSEYPSSNRDFGMPPHLRESNLVEIPTAHGNCVTFPFKGDWQCWCGALNKGYFIEIIRRVLTLGRENG